MEKADIKVSVITPTYNRANLLKTRVIPSVLNQTYTNFEYIIVDDGSTDETNKIMQDFASNNKIKYIKFPKNRGTSIAINTAIKSSSGDYICFLDDDDEYLPTFLEETVKKISKSTEEYGGVTCGFIINYGNLKAYAAPDVSHSSYIAIDGGWLLKREVFFKNNIFFDENLSNDADADLGIRFFQIYKADTVNKPLIIKYAEKRKSPRLGDISEKRLKGLDKFLERHLVLFKKAGKNDLSYIYFYAGYTFCLGKKMKRGRLFFKKSLSAKISLRIFFHLIAAYLGFLIYRIFWNLERKLSIFRQAFFTNRISPEIKKILKEKNL